MGGHERDTQRYYFALPPIKGRITSECMKVIWHFVIDIQVKNGKK